MRVVATCERRGSAACYDRRDVVCSLPNTESSKSVLGYNDGMVTNASKPLLAAYLVTGSDELKKETVIRRLHARISQMGDLEFNFDRFNGENASAEDITAACNTLPFASDVRLVQVDSADRLKKSDMEAIVAYLGHPNENTVLCLVATSITKNTRIYKAVAKLGKSAVIDCAPINRRDLPARVREMAPTHGITLTPSAANALIDLVGENTVAIDAELRKIALAHAGTDPVNDNEVNALVSRTAEVKPWEFVNAFSSRNAKKCILLRQRMESVSDYALLGMCVTRIRELIATQSLAKRGQSAQLADQLKMPAWRVKNHALWARGFTPAELRSALASARDTERAMKSGSDPESAFTEWYLSVIAG